MTLELYINGFLHDTMKNRLPLEKATKAMKSKWWFLLAKNDWKIYRARESKMSRPLFQLVNPEYDN